MATMHRSVSCQPISRKHKDIADVESLCLSATSWLYGAVFLSAVSDPRDIFVVHSANPFFVCSGTVLPCPLLSSHDYPIHTSSGRYSVCCFSVF